jgi:hypothetical protein
MDKLTGIKEQVRARLFSALRRTPRDAGETFQEQRPSFTPEDIEIFLNKLEPFVKVLILLAVLSYFGLKAYEARTPITAPEPITALALERQLGALGMRIPDNFLNELEIAVLEKTQEASFLPVEISSFPSWAGRFTTAYSDLGLTDVNGNSVPIKVIDIPEGLSGKMLCVGEEETEIQIDKSNTTQRAAIALLAHEVAHKQAEICNVTTQDYEKMGEFAIALWSDEHEETEAQLLALESLSYIWEMTEEESIKGQAKDAFFYVLSNIISKAQKYVMLAHGSSSTDSPESLSDAYMYGYLPAAQLYQALSLQDTYFEVLLKPESEDTPHILHIPLTHTGKLLSEEGIQFGQA